MHRNGIIMWLKGIFSSQYFPWMSNEFFYGFKKIHRCVAFQRVGLMCCASFYLIHAIFFLWFLIILCGVFMVQRDDFSHFAFVYFVLSIFVKLKNISIVLFTKRILSFIITMGILLRKFILIMYFNSNCRLYILLFVLCVLNAII